MGKEERSRGFTYEGIVTRALATSDSNHLHFTKSEAKDEGGGNSFLIVLLLHPLGRALVGDSQFLQIKFL